MSIVELRFEAHRCVRLALRCADPVRMMELLSEGHRLTNLADEIASKEGEPPAAEPVRAQEALSD
jgi:hypothetical protein